MASVKLIKFLDRYFGSLLCLLLSAFNLLGAKRNNQKKILIVQLWGMGETILCLPAIKALKSSRKNPSIDILVTNRVKDIFYNNKSLDDIISIKLSPFSILKFILKNYRKYDIAIDMEEYLNISAIIAFFAGKERIGYSHGIRSGLYTKKVRYDDRQHVVFTFLDLLKPLGIRSSPNSLEKLNFSKNDKEKVDGLLKKYMAKGKEFIVGFGIGAAESVRERMWPEERFAAVADYLIGEYNAKIIFIGNGGESAIAQNVQAHMKNKNNSFDFTGKTTMREMFYLISLCGLFIGNDSGPMHAAAAQSVKTIGLFGCNLPVRFKPFGKNGLCIYKKDSGKACINVHKGEVEKCRHGKENACVKRIQVKDAIRLVDRILKK